LISHIVFFSVNLSMDGDLGVVDTSAAVSLVSVCQQLSGGLFLERLLKEQQQNSITTVLTVRELVVSVLCSSPSFCFCVYAGLPNRGYIVCTVSKFFCSDSFYHHRRHHCSVSSFLITFCYCPSFSKH